MNDEEFQKLLNAQAPLVLTTGETKFVLVLCAGAASVASGMYNFMDNTSHAMNMLAFGLLIMAFAWWTMNPKKVNLTLHGEGFEVRSPFGVIPYLWKNVTPFVAEETAAAPALKQMDTIKNIKNLIAGKSYLPWGMATVWKEVFFDDGSKSAMAEINRAAGKLGCSLSITYGLTADQLAQLLNHWRERAIAANK